MILFWEIISLLGFILGIAGLFVGIWDLRVDLSDRDQDKNHIQWFDDKKD